MVCLIACAALGCLTVGCRALVAFRTRETGIGKRDAGSEMRDAEKVAKTKRQLQKESVSEGEPRIPHPPSRIPTKSKPTPPPSRTPHLVPAACLIPPLTLFNPPPLEHITPR